MSVGYADIVAYVGGDLSWPMAEVDNAIAAEEANQRAHCRIPDPVPDDLTEALKRRVIRNLAMRSLAVSVPQGDAELGPVVLPGRDPEVRRLEAPYRRLVVG